VYDLVKNSKGVVSRAVGLPDLHQGPTGISVLAKAPIPKLPGPDIGCGMSLFVTDIPADLSIKKIVKRMERLNLDEGEDFDDPDLGTIGGGNHFAELQYIDGDVPLDPAFESLLGPDARYKAFLMVHSGSRSHGSKLFAELGDGSDPERYMLEHMKLVEWAKKNRMEIARRFIEQFTGSDSSARPAPLVDIAHNWIESLPDNRGFLHRKGAAPSTPGSLSLLPGSRATASYVLVCNGEMERDLCSVAHGAGRRLSRSDAKSQGDIGRISLGKVRLCAPARTFSLRRRPMPIRTLKVLLPLWLIEACVQWGAGFYPWRRTRPGKELLTITSARGVGLNGNSYRAFLGIDNGIMSNFENLLVIILSSNS
jgi:RNA-splicing ligase RtcB